MTQNQNKPNLKKNLRRVICWGCDEEFKVDVEGYTQDKVVLVLGADNARAKTQKPKTKLIIKCPHCGKENEVRV